MDKYVFGTTMMIGLAALIVGAGTLAFLSDIETTSDNTMTAGELNLVVNDGPDPYIGSLIQIMDLKPEHTSYSNTIDLTLDNNPGKVYKKIKDIQCGPSASDLDLAEELWFDLSVDGRQLIPVGVKTMKELEGKWIYLGVYGPGIKVPVVQSFHLQMCLSSWSPQERCTFTEEFAVEQTNAPAVENCYNPLGGNCPGEVQYP